jgi:3-dehydroquinate dehydratase-1
MDFDSFVLAASTADLGDEPAAREHADCVEFRLDLASDPAAALRDYAGALPLLVTNRVEWEGGEAPDAPERYQVLEQAVEHPLVEAVDLELAALEAAAPGAKRVLSAARDREVTVVVSAHDFETTPKRPQLRETLEAACAVGDVGKVAVTATDRGEALDLLAVTHELSAAGERVATMAMGEAGRHTRAVAPLYGSRIGYAPVRPSEATAPGQYDLATLARLVASLSPGAED